jgi:hypothetical protein
MKILLQDRKTGLYVQGSGVLTDELESAVCFNERLRAMGVHPVAQYHLWKS